MEGGIRPASVESKYVSNRGSKRQGWLTMSTGERGMARDQQQDLSPSGAPSQFWFSSSADQNPSSLILCSSAELWLMPVSCWPTRQHGRTRNFFMQLPASKTSEQPSAFLSQDCKILVKLGFQWRQRGDDVGGYEVPEKNNASTAYICAAKEHIGREFRHLQGDVGE